MDGVLDMAGRSELGRRIRLCIASEIPSHTASAHIAFLDFNIAQHRIQSLLTDNGIHLLSSVIIYTFTG